MTRATTITAPASRLAARLLASLAMAVGPVAAPAWAQFDNPVYVDDSTAARDTLTGLDSVISSQNLSEAVRVLQRALETDGARVLERGGDDRLYVSVRTLVHERLLETPALLERYREIEGPFAEAAMDNGGFHRVERDRLLTRAGFDAALAVAHSQIHRGVFDAARFTLEQLERHPDRRGARAEQAAIAAHDVARYLDRPRVWAWSARWARDAGLDDPARVPQDWPPRLLRRAMDPTAPGPEVLTEGLVATPLQSVQVAEPNELADRRAPASVRTASGAREPEPSPAWIYPMVLGETVFTNDGGVIRALDRFTLNPRWKLELADEPDTGNQETARRIGRQETIRPGTPFEDVSSITWCYPHLLAVGGRAYQSGREGNPRLHAIDPQTGELVWAVAVAGELDEQLEFASIRGAPLCDGSTVVVAARKYIPSRRTNSAYLVGVDLATGAKRWVRLIGSIGALPHRMRTLIGGRSTLHQGVVYRTDELGVLAAVEADTGRVRWIRRSEGPSRRSGNDSRPWEGLEPIIDGNSLISLNRGAGAIERVALDDGRLLGELPLASLSQPQYLVRAGDWLVGVGRGFVAALPIGEFESAIPRSPRGDLPVFVGRASPVGDRVLLPVRDGAVLFDPSDPDATETIELERSGHVLPVESQLLVADDLELHSYLVWDVAVRLLRERIESSQGDPTPARTLAELAFRAGRVEEILPAVDVALDALNADPLADMSAARREVFGAIQTMVTAAQHGSADAPDGATALAQRSDIVGDLIGRLGVIAGSPTERVAHLMAQGEHDEGERRPDAAARAYQRVLDDRTLADAIWIGPELLVRGDFEARRRLARLVLDHGPRIYALYDQEARAAAVGAANDAAALAALAQRYPVGAAAPELWLRSAEAEGDDPRAELERRVDALQAGLDASDRYAIAGGVIDAAIDAELTGRLIIELAELGEAERAMHVLAEQRARRPELQLTSRGSPLPPELIADALTSAQRDAMPRPVIGAAPDVQNVRVLANWRPIEPITSAPGELWPDRALMRSIDGSEIALWTAVDGAGALERVWERDLGSSQTELVWWDEESAWLLTRPVSGPAVNLNVGGWSLERVDLATGESAWSVGPFEDLFDGMPARGLPDASGGAAPVRTPAEGDVPLGDVLISGDGRTLAIVERSGRAASIDLLTGRVLWAWRGPIRRVFDAVLDDGRLAIAGRILPEPGPDGGPPADFGPALAVYNARTGEEAYRPRIDKEVHWLRAARGALLVGFDDLVVSFELQRGEPNYQKRIQRFGSNGAAWVAGERLYATRSGRRLHWVEIDSGRTHRDNGLDAGGRLNPLDTVRVLATDGGGAVAASASGVVFVGPDGELTGFDALGVVGGLTRSVIASTDDGRAVVLAAEASLEAEVSGVRTIGLFGIDAETGVLRVSERLDLPLAPERVRALNGRVLLDTRLGVVSVPFPVRERAGEAPGEQDAGAPTP